MKGQELNRKMRYGLAVLATLAAGAPFSAQAWDEFNDRSLEGGHVGKVVSGNFEGKRADLILKAIPGRGQSFIGALLIDDERHVFFYQVDFSLSDGDWSMIPISGTSDGEVIAASDTNPSLTLGRTLDKHRNRVLEISSANSPNTQGFYGVIDFPDKDCWHSEYQWLELRDGVYKCRRCDGFARVAAPLIRQKNEGTINFTMPNLSNKHRMRLKTEEIFAIHAWSRPDTGTTQAEMPARLAISVHKGPSDRIILSDPRTGSVESLERK